MLLCIADSSKVCIMPLATDCMYQGCLIGLEEAIRIKNAWRRGLERPVFTCKECGNIVTPHQDVNGHTPHIEHRRRNPSCSLSNKQRNSKRPQVKSETYSLDDLRAIEGYGIDREIFQYGRNRKIADERKRLDGYRCSACGFYLRIAGRFVIECHHLNPVASSGLREVRISELVSLCPTCHRIAHTRAEPYSVAEIQEFRGVRTDPSNLMPGNKGGQEE